MALIWSIVQAEVRHLGGGTEVGRFLQPDRNPVLVQLEADIFEIRADLLHVLHQAVRAGIDLLQAAINFAVRHAQSDRLIVEAVGFLVGLGSVGLLHQVGGLLEIVILLAVRYA